MCLHFLLIGFMPKLELKSIEMIKEFKEYYGLDISYHHSWFGKQLAKLEVHGDEPKSFNELTWYSEVVKFRQILVLFVLECDPLTRKLYLKP